MKEEDAQVLIKYFGGSFFYLNECVVINDVANANDIPLSR